MSLNKLQIPTASLLLVFFLSGCSWLNKSTVSEDRNSSEKTYNLQSLNLYSLAETAILNRNYPFAVELLEKAAKSDQQELYIKERLIQILFFLAQENQEYQKKLRTLGEKYVKDNTYNSNMIYTLARFFATQEENNKADEYFRKAIEMQPDQQKLLVYYLFQKKTKPHAEIELLEKAEKLPWENPELALLLGELYFKIDEKKGIEILEKAHEKWNNRETFEKLIVYYSRRFPSQKIINLIEERLAADEEVSSSLQQYFIELNFREQNFEKIIQHKNICYELNNQEVLRYLFFAASKLNNHQLAAEIGEYIAQNKDLATEQRDSFYQYVALEYFHLKNYSKTAYFLNQINEPHIIIYFFHERMLTATEDEEIIAILKEMEKYETNKTNFVLANVYATLDKKKLSLEYLTKVDDNFIEENKLYSIAGLTYLINSEDTKKAYELFSHAEEVNANEEIALYLLSQDKPEKAFGFMKKAMEDTLQAVSYIFLADYYEQNAQTDSALHILQSASKIYPENADILNYYGYFIAQKELSQLYDEAEKVLKKALQLEPESHYIWDSLAWLYVKQENFSEAKKTFKKVLEFDFNSSEEAYHLGYFYWKIDNLKQAKQFLRTAIKLNNDDDYVKKSEKLLKKILEKDEK
ncbi:MAG: tetratricopeptide repeat protein [Candidatus Cloacimonadota bacterium]|nr:tetratricopeptide repeat protein [Candidatus Cloacimonadota bacterium]